ncbi:mitochondrial carrier domain-containing protein [Sordaria brevicollis]|uniref:Mitochondrial carrier domain-containing protein n=1 Tax=Sordaria brevicollis TaxID=83679 RepID=A0AAE0U9S6_SORBR|nr:mitochondrial carrier domain-containing protein [Sordaria brevicollis]
MPPHKTPDDDIESGQSESQATTINEETPLLISQSDDHQRVRPDDHSIEEEAVLNEGSRYTRSYFAWRIFWAILAITVTVVFVKAWIDAGADVNFDFKKALQRALGGGISGAAAMVLQVLTLMPLRTIMNYQYRFGTSFTTATRTLYRQGGLRRYYAGMGAALFQGPAARFGDTAANAGIHALLQSNSFLKHLPITVQDTFASLCAAAFRMILTPIDTLKTTLQAQGPRGTAILRQRIKTDGVGSLWWGAFATAAATFVGNYPWYATHDYLLEIIPEPDRNKELVGWLLRLAVAGFVASVVSDSVSNSLRVVKTFRQVNAKRVSYSEAARLVVVNDGITGLLGRGLKTRILCNGLQGLMFSILWKLFLDIWNKKTAHL